MKKGTGSELMADHTTEKRLRRGAFTLFQPEGKGCSVDVEILARDYRPAVYLSYLVQQLFLRRSP